MREGERWFGSAEVRSWNALHRELLRRFREAGLMERRRWPYAWRGVAVSAAYALGFGMALRAGAWPLRLAWLWLAAVAAIQGGMISHDLVHRAVTPDRRWARWLGQYFMTLLAGQAFGHWEWQHQEHHRCTQEPAADPDMEVAAFALSREDARSKRGLFRVTARWQHLLIWPVLTLMVFSIRASTVAWVWRRRSWLDAAGLAAHAALWMAVPAAVVGWKAAAAGYAAFTWMMGPYAAGSFIWNHVGTRVMERGERMPFIVQRVLCSRNLSDHWALTALFGSLNIHIEHHLAPGIPGPSLPRARPIFRAFCKEHRLPFREWGYGQAIAEVYRHFRDVGESARMR